MYKKKTVRLITLILVLTILVISLSSCNNKKKAEKTAVDHVYRQTEIELPDDIQGVNNVFIQNDRINFVAVSYSEPDYVAKYSILSVDSKGSDMEKKEVNFDFSGVEGYHGSYLSHIIGGKDNKLYVFVEVWKNDPVTWVYESDTLLLVLDQDYNLLEKVNLKEKLASQLKEDYFYINQIATDEKGYLYISFDNKVFIFDDNFKYLFNIELDENSWINKMFRLPGGNVAVAMSYESTEGYKNKICKIDIENKKFSDAMDVNTHLSNNIYYIFSGMNDQLYYWSETGIFKYDADTDISTELLNWINSDIETVNMDLMQAISDEKFISVAYDYDYITYRSRLTLSIFDYIPADQVVPKYIITLGTAYGSYDIKREVIAFNKKSNEYRIQIKDYGSESKYSDYQEIIDAFNNDIVAGNLPDIVFVNEAMPFDSYISKGIFYDIYKLMDKDSEFNKQDYFQNVLDAFSVNGKLYSLSPSFVVETVAIKSKFVDPEAKGWTMGQLQALMTRLPDDTVTFLGETRDGILRTALGLTMDNYIDKNTGKCSFDSSEFIELLKFSKQFDEKSIWEDFDYENAPPGFFDKYYDAYKDDRAILNTVTLTYFEQFISLKNYTFYDDITLIGFPVSSGNGSAINAYQKLAISTKSDLKEGAWEFIKFMLSDAAQESITYQWPLKISAFDKLAQKAIEGEQNQGGIIYRDFVYDSVDMMPAPYYQERITRQEVDYIKSFIKGVTNMVSIEEGVFDIVAEETKMYYAGHKTSEETAKIIQSRVQIYVSEGR